MSYWKWFKLVVLSLSFWQCRIITCFLYFVCLLAFWNVTFVLFLQHTKLIICFEKSPSVFDKPIRMSGQSPSFCFWNEHKPIRISEGSPSFCFWNENKPIRISENPPSFFDETTINLSEFLKCSENSPSFVFWKTISLSDFLKIHHRFFFETTINLSEFLKIHHRFFAFMTKMIYIHWKSAAENVQNGLFRSRPKKSARSFWLRFASETMTKP